MALPFVDQIFPANLTVGLSGVIFFNTVEVTTPAGISDLYELGVDYGRLQYTFDSSQLENSGTEMLELKDFYIKNRYNSFRLLDPIESEVPPSNPESFGTGDGSTVAFQLEHDIGGGIEKPITKPIDDSDFKIYIDTIEQTETTDYTVDYDTGIVTFVSAPAGAESLTWSGNYHIHVRFDNDSLNANISGLRRGNFTGIGLVEEITV